MTTKTQRLDRLESRDTGRRGHVPLWHIRHGESCAEAFARATATGFSSVGFLVPEGSRDLATWTARAAERKVEREARADPKELLSGTR